MKKEKEEEEEEEEDREQDKKTNEISSRHFDTLREIIHYQSKYISRLERELRLLKGEEDGR